MNPAAPADSRLSLMAAALVVARRDFFAILLSRAFLFFLLGPLFPIVVGALAGGIGSQTRQQVSNPELAVLLPAAEAEAVVAAHDALGAQLGNAIPPLVMLDDPLTADPGRLLAERPEAIAAVLSGTLDRPVLTGPADQLERMRGKVALLAATALERAPASFPDVATRTVATSGANVLSARMITAQAGQMLLFLLTMLLAGMVLSNLVEEKANKIIEILAAAIPMDAVFFGKLFAMLAVSFVGITVWGLVIALVMGLGGFSMQSLPAPAVGWPLFIALGIAYFAMAYLLLGSIFLTIGSQAKTVREVQTLSMPATMLQLMVFFAASLAVKDMGGPLEWGAVIFPFSSPFAMLARAALQEGVTQHIVALAWQALAVAAFVRLGAGLFRRRVMQSGNAGRTGRSLFTRRKRAAA